MQGSGLGAGCRLALLGSLLTAVLCVTCVGAGGASLHNVVSMSQGPHHTPNIRENNPGDTSGQHLREDAKDAKLAHPQIQQVENNFVATGRSHDDGSLQQDSNSLKNLGSAGSSSGCVGAAQVGSIFCPNSHMMCPDGNTCCWMNTQCWGCCPYSDAVCCPDGAHCCPAGYTCGTTYCSCGGEIRLPFSNLKTACSKPNLWSFLKTSYLRKRGRRP